MNSLFSSQAKKDVREFFDILLMGLAICVLVALFSQYHWICNLFDQLWYFYLWVALLISVFFCFPNYL